MAEQDGRFAIHEAAREGRLQVVESLLNANPKLASRRDDDDRLPLHWATSYNHIAIVTALITTTRSTSLDIDAQDSAGWTALMTASSLPDDSGLPLLELLLSQEADPKIQSLTGGTALHFAVSKNNLGVSRRLVAAGASARVRDKRGQTPLHRAAAGGSVPLVKLLLGPAGKAPVNGADVDGSTPLHHAVAEGHGDVAVELLRAGAEPDRKDRDGRLAIECAPDAKVRGFIVTAAEREGIDL